MCEDENSIVYVMFVVVYNFNRKTLLPVIPRESGGLIFIFKLWDERKKESKKFQFLMKFFFVKIKGAWQKNATVVAK